jgi:DNA polymerase elongation subunit (family B)
MINSMYGRLGMRKIDSYSFIEEYKNLDYLRKKIDVISYKELNEIILVEAENNKKLINFLNVNQIKSKNNIVLASCITSKARIKLYNAQNEVIKNHGRILYSDTDSIFAAFKKNVLGEKHGEVY